jgi:hypothetical protein
MYLRAAWRLVGSVGIVLVSVTSIWASSHREAPFVTLIADYSPLQDAFGGPNYY